MKRYTRGTHEQFAVEAARTAISELPYTYNCDPGAVYALVRAKTDIARARVHLAVISMGGSSRRTVRLWGVVQRAENRVNEASNRVARCLKGARP